MLQKEEEDEAQQRATAWSNKQATGIWKHRTWICNVIFRM